MYYYDLKLILLGFRRSCAIPFPEMIGITAASENDLTAFKMFFDHVLDRVIFADMAFLDEAYFNIMYRKQNVIMLTPVKSVKGDPELIKQREKRLTEICSQRLYLKSVNPWSRFSIG